MAADFDDLGKQVITSTTQGWILTWDLHTFELKHQFQVRDHKTAIPERLGLLRDICEEVMIASYSHKTNHIYVTKDAEHAALELQSPVSYALCLGDENGKRGNVKELKVTINQKMLLANFDNGSILIFDLKDLHMI